jgi:hypothetical protein
MDFNSDETGDALEKAGWASDNVSCRRGIIPCLSATLRYRVVSADSFKKMVSILQLPLAVDESKMST